MNDIVPEIKPCVRQPNATRIIRAFGDEMRLHLGSSDTNGKLCMWTNITPPKGGPPPHYHEREDECFFPLSGPAEFFIDGQWTTVPAQTSVFMPIGSVHAFRNPSDEPLHMLIQTMPGGFEHFFAECEKEFAKNSQPDMARIVEVSAKYGIHYVDEA